MTVGKVHRLTRDDFYKMGQMGIIAPEDRIELIDGQLIEMAPIGPLHLGITTKLSTKLAVALNDIAFVSGSAAINLDQFNELQPDITIAHFREDWYTVEIPAPKDIIALVEVSDTTLNKDRTIKASKYALAGIREYWIINLNEKQIEVCTDPEDGEYKSRLILTAKDNLTLAQFDWNYPISELLRGLNI